MNDNRIRVGRKKEAEKPLWRRLRLPLSLAALLVIAAAGGFLVLSTVGNLNIFAGSTQITTENGGTVIRVPPGGDLQAAIGRASGGDTIELAAGATYGPIKLPVKQIQEFITIRSSAADKLPERVGPEQGKLLARIVTREKGEPAVATENGAHHYRFVGIEFAPETTEYIYNLVLFGGDHRTRADVPHHLEIDRSYFHPAKTGVTRRGLALNSSETVVKNSYFEGFAFPGEETQGICGWTGTKDVRILDNHIEGGAENIMFGGADPVSSDLTPEGIEIRGNYLFKPYDWREKNYSLKTLFELKNAKRVQLIGNFLENNPLGSAFRITIRNSSGKAEFSTLEDVLIEDNIVLGAGEGINILGKDDTYPSQTLRGLKIVNNLFLDIGGDKWEGGGYFIQVNDGRNILIANNTVFQTGNIVTFYGVNPENFVFRNNIVGHGNYGIHGLGDVRRSDIGRRFFRKNVIVNNRNVPASDMTVPPDNFSLKSYSEIKFADLQHRDLRLSADSGVKGKGVEGADIGADIETIRSNMPASLFKLLSQ
ncbi:MAG: hypothetical protein R2747_08995 [Pyrinomonadaceae bacterium]